MFSIKDFRASIDNQGVLKNNRHLVTIPMPNVVQDKTIGELLSLRCESAVIPGIDLASADGPPRFGYGPQQKHPYNATFGDISLTFLVDKDSLVHRFFYQWVTGIVNTNSRGGTNMNKQTNGKYPYESAYKDDYAITLNIDIYNDLEQKVFTVLAYQAFPSTLPSVSTSWSDTDLIKINVPFTFTDFEIVYKV